MAVFGNRWKWALGAGLLSLSACGLDFGLFGDAAPAISATDDVGEGGFDGSSGSAMGGSGPGSATGGAQSASATGGGDPSGGPGPSTGVGGGAPGAGGAGQGGGSAAPPVCDPPCGFLMPVCCDKGNGPTCVANALGCACDPNNPGDVCAFTDVCCDKGSGPVCHSNADSCDCGSAPSVCDFFFDVCCDKGQGKKCYANPGGCF